LSKEAREDEGAKRMSNPCLLSVSQLKQLEEYHIHPTSTNYRKSSPSHHQEVKTKDVTPTNDVYGKVSANFFLNTGTDDSMNLSSLRAENPDIINS
jgi:hypothetical protein